MRFSQRRKIRKNIKNLEEIRLEVRKISIEDEVSVKGVETVLRKLLKSRKFN